MLSRVFFAAALLFANAQDKTADGSNTVTVAAASDLSAALEKLAPVFEKKNGEQKNGEKKNSEKQNGENKNGVHVSVILGSSGNFFAQIQNGAPFDVYLSADKSYPEKLEQAGKTEPGTLVSYAPGRLVIWVPNGSTVQLPSKDNKTLDGNLDILNGPAVRKIAIANPDHAPYGRAAVAVLQHYKVYDQVTSKLVLGENISQTAQFAQSGNADVAFIALSIAMSASMQHSGHYLMLPDESYPPLEQAGVVLQSSRNKPMSRRFLEFLTSPEAQAILHEFGFEAPGK